jgi:hypothetical protein
MTEREPSKEDNELVENDNDFTENDTEFDEKVGHKLTKHERQVSWHRYAIFQAMVQGTTSTYELARLMHVVNQRPQGTFTSFSHKRRKNCVIT